MDYREVYFVLCAAISDALDVLPETAENRDARLLLENAMRQTEEMVMEDEKKSSR